MSPKVISTAQAENVCKIGQGNQCCSYLILDGDGWGCAKNSHFSPMINQRRLEGTMTAMSDNCSGPPDFTPNQQT